MIRYILFSLFGFLSGSIMYSAFLPKIFYGYNVLKESSDKNPGAGNIITDVNIPFGLLCLFLDIQKGFVPIFFALKYLDINNFLFTFVIIAPILGHSFSPFLKFKGGKAIAVTYGAYIALLPQTPIVIYLIIIMVTLSFVISISPHSLRVIISMAFFCTVTLFIHDIKAVTISVFITSIIVIIKHIMNYGNEKPSIRFIFYNKIQEIINRI